MEVAVFTPRAAMALVVTVVVVMVMVVMLMLVLVLLRIRSFFANDFDFFAVRPNAEPNLISNSLLDGFPTLNSHVRTIFMATRIPSRQLSPRRRGSYDLILSGARAAEPAYLCVSWRLIGELYKLLAALL